MDAIMKMLRFLEVLSKDNIYYSTIIQIIKNISHVPSMTIYELAKVCFVSPSTISRLAKMLGYQNYLDFKTDVATALGRPAQPPQEPYTDSLQDAHPLPIPVSHYLKSISQLFESMRATLDQEMLEEAVTLLHRAKKVGLFFQELYYTLELQRALFIDGKCALLIKTLPDEMDYVEELDENDVILITVHNSVEFGHKQPILKRAKEKGVKIIMVYCGPVCKEQEELIDYLFAFKSSDYLTDNFFFGVYLKIITMAYQNIL